MNKKILEKYYMVNSIVEQIDDYELNALSAFLCDRIKNIDSYVMMFGETSSGKSTIINGLMREDALFVSSAPSTAAITEVEFKDEISENSFYAINKDATIEKIDNKVFNDLLKNPDKDLQRLKLVTKTTKYDLSNMRLFDTPGYGSIIDEHDEVLKEFIPNSDIIIYTINYRIGVQENDYAFLKFLKELTRDNIEIILLINRCPENINKSDRRIIEIQRYIFDILHNDIKTFFIKNEFVEDGYPLPLAEELWTYIEKIINSPKRLEVLEEAFEQYIIELLGKCEILIEKEYQNIKLSQNDKEKTKALSDKFMNNVEKLIPTLIEPTFDKLIKSIPNKLKSSKYNIESSVMSSIDKVSTISMEENITYVSNHLLPYSTFTETLELKRYIEITLEELNEKVNDYLNAEIIQFNKDIEICFSTELELATKSMGKKVGTEFVKGGLTKYFVSFGGAGGAGAGVANAASHTLKVAGDFFGKTFTRETHNTLKRVLAKIGATSVRSIANAATVIVELLSVIIEYGTWKAKLKKKAGIAINDWHNEIFSVINEDIIKLKKENIDTLKSIIKDQTSKYEYNEQVKDEKEITTLVQNLKNIKDQLGV